VGITLPQAGQQATRENVIQTAQQAEKEGFDSLWFFERVKKQIRGSSVR